MSLNSKTVFKSPSELNLKQIMSEGKHPNTKLKIKFNLIGVHMATSVSKFTSKKFQTLYKTRDKLLNASICPKCVLFLDRDNNLIQFK